MPYSTRCAAASSGPHVSKEWGSVMFSPNVIFWEVDTQADFMVAGGKLYVPGAEKLIPNLRRLVNAAREGRVFLVSDACVHTLEDEEFKQWPPHCVRGTPGAEIDRKSTRLNSSHLVISYAVFCLKKKKKPRP